MVVAVYTASAIQRRRETFVHRTFRNARALTMRSMSFRYLAKFWGPQRTSKRTASAVEDEKCSSVDPAPLSPHHLTRAMMSLRERKGRRVDWGCGFRGHGAMGQVHPGAGHPRG